MYSTFTFKADKLEGVIKQANTELETNIVILVVEEVNKICRHLCHFIFDFVNSIT